MIQCNANVEVHNSSANISVSIEASACFNSLPDAVLTTACLTRPSRPVIVSSTIALIQSFRLPAVINTKFPILICYVVILLLFLRLRLGKYSFNHRAHISLESFRLLLKLFSSVSARSRQVANVDLEPDKFPLLK